MPTPPRPRRALPLALAAILASPVAGAATITVTTLADGSVPGECTLRDATIAATRAENTRPSRPGGSSFIISG